MVALSPIALMAAWAAGSPDPPHQRLAALLAAVVGEAAIADDTLGGRNRRLLDLHQALVGARLEAVVGCEACEARSEFVIPVEAIAASPAPAPDARVRIRAHGRTIAFRLPRMSDIEAAGGRRDAILQRCALSQAPVDAAVAKRIGERFEALDPAANVVLNIACSGCGTPIAASVDVAAFVARDLDRLVEGLFRDVDLIAGAYGWDEVSILSLPPARRRRYVAMIAEARVPSQPYLARRSA